MSFELVYTSAPKGLKPGSRGYCSVAFTEGMPANYVQFCESISGYVHVYMPQEPGYPGNNPIAYSHLLVTLGGKEFSVLSRVSACAADYTGRTNMLAQHLMASDDEKQSAPSGPAVLVNNNKVVIRTRSEAMFIEEWSGAPAYQDVSRVKLPSEDVRQFKAETWAATCGDVGPTYAGRLAQAFLDAPDKPSYIIFNPEMKNLLPLLAEAQALLPPEKRWNVTFSTYFTSLPVGMKCAWRCCLEEADALNLAHRQGALIIDLVKKSITDSPARTTNELIDLARSGEPVKRVERHGPVLKPIANSDVSASADKQSAGQNGKREQSNDQNSEVPRWKRLPPLWLGLICALVVVGVVICIYPLVTEKWRDFHADVQGVRIAALPASHVDKNEPMDVPVPAKPPVPSESKERAARINQRESRMLKSSDEGALVMAPPKPDSHKAGIDVGAQGETNAHVVSVPVPTERHELQTIKGLADGKIPFVAASGLNFYGTNGAFIDSRLSFERDAYLDVNDGTTLAGVKKDGNRQTNLTAISAAVGVVEMRGAGISNLYVVAPLQADVTNESPGVYALHLPETVGASRLLEHVIVDSSSARVRVTPIVSKTNSIQAIIREVRQSEYEIIVGCDGDHGGDFLLEDSDPRSVELATQMVELNGLKEKYKDLSSKLNILTNKASGTPDAAAKKTPKKSQAYDALGKATIDAFNAYCSIRPEKESESYGAWKRSLFKIEGISLKDKFSKNAEMDAIVSAIKGMAENEDYRLKDKAFILGVDILGASIRTLHRKIIESEEKVESGKKELDAARKVTIAVDVDDVRIISGDMQ